MEKNAIINLIYSVIENVNLSLSDEKKIPTSYDTKLYGAAGQLDSLGMVNFIVALENKIEKDFGCSIKLLNEKTLLQKNSPFETVDSLSEYIEHQLDDRE
tara:strand:+ start:279 stop:578 length:300 start_codon:yes stop_codon:yes gene_type:complete